MVFTVYVNVLPQDNLSDPQGKAALHALKELKYQSVSDVRVGKRIRLEIEAEDVSAAIDSARQAARDLLANPISEQFEIESVS